MTNELQTVGAMHQCRAGEPYSTCVHCGALAEALNKPCPHFMRDAAKKLSTVVPTPQADSAPASLAGPMQFGGCPECGSRTCVARQCSRTVSHAAQALPGGVQWQCGPQASGFTAPQADSQPAPQGETNAQLDIDSNSSAPGQQRDVAGSVALGQPVGNGSDQAAGHTGAQGDKLLIVAERNIRSFLRSAVFKSESDREAALNCVDVLWEAASAPADSVTAPAGVGVARALSDAQIEAMPVWRNFVGLWPESRREIVDAVADLLATPTPPAQAADSVLEDAARWN